MKEKPWKIKGNDNMEMHIVRAKGGLVRTREMAKSWAREHSPASEAGW